VKQSDFPVFDRGRALKLVYGVLMRASARWRRVGMGEAERHQLITPSGEFRDSRKGGNSCLVWAIRFYREIGT